MTETASAFTSETDSAAAGRLLGKQVTDALEGAPPDAMIVFASSRHDFAALLGAIQDTCRPAILLGASSAGEFVRGERGEGMASALALRSSDMKFTASVGSNLTRDRSAAARQLVASFQGRATHAYPHRAAFIMTDALAGHADELIEELTMLTSGLYQFFGGGAGDDAQFRRTHVFLGSEPVPDAVVALEILSLKPLGIGVAHGWTIASKGHRVTESDGLRLVSLDGLPAAQVFHEHARQTGQKLIPADPVPFFLHNVLGIDTGHGHRLRVPLAINADDSISCAAEIPQGAVVYFMKATSSSAAEAAALATRSAVSALGGAKPQAALFFDCVATRLRMGDDFGFELSSVADLLGDADYVGCNTYGQIARAEGQFEGFHNCTAVVAVFPS